MNYITDFDKENFSPTYNTLSRLRPGFGEYLWFDIPLDIWKGFISENGNNEAPQAFLENYDSGRYKDCVYSFEDLTDIVEDIYNLTENDWQEIDEMIEYAANG